MSHRMAPFSASGNGVTVGFQVGPQPTAQQFDNLLPQPQVGATGPINNFNKARSVLLSNAGPDTVFVELCGTQGSHAVTAATGVPLFPNTSRVFGTSGSTFVAAISATATGAKLYATPGEGGV